LIAKPISMAKETGEQLSTTKSLVRDPL
jgi:hypothetical protein